MSWITTLGEDRVVEIIVDPNFGGDLAAAARVHPVWIVDSEKNTALVEAARTRAASEDLYEINRISPVTLDPERDFVGHIRTLHSHYNWSKPRYEFIISRGVVPTPLVKQSLNEYGFEIVESGIDCFNVKVHPNPSFNTLDYK